MWVSKRRCGSMMFWQRCRVSTLQDFMTHAAAQKCLVIKHTRIMTVKIVKVEQKYSGNLLKIKTTHKSTETIK